MGGGLSVCCAKTFTAIAIKKMVRHARCFTRATLHQITVMCGMVGVVSDCAQDPINVQHPVALNYRFQFPSNYAQGGIASVLTEGLRVSDARSSR